MNQTRINLVLAIAVAMFMSGCKTMEFNGPNWFNQDERPRLRMPLPKMGKKKEEVVYAVPQKMAVIWKDTTMSQPGNGVTRGFGGRVYFYDNENKPTRVEGEMVVYGFDTDSGKPEPDKKFVFEREKLQGHYGRTDLGHSYSFWVPWDAAGGERKSITLIPVFKDKEGKVVKGGQTINVLPGRTPKMAKKEERKSFESNKRTDIQLASGVDEKAIINNAAMKTELADGMRETTIRLPKHLADRLNSTPADMGPVNVVRETQKAIDATLNAVDLRNQTRDELNAEIQRKFQSQPETNTGESSKQRTRVFGKPAPFGE